MIPHPEEPTTGGYFDYNATSPLSRTARNAWLEAQEHSWHNPSSLYPQAAHVDHLLDAARLRIADLIGCEAPERILFVCGATEANNALFTSIAGAYPGAAVATGGTEHPSVLEPSRAHFGEYAIRLRHQPDGRLDLESLEEYLAGSSSRRAALPLSVVSVMAANNETGTLQPWKQIAEVCRRAGVAFHSDAAQWIGKLPAGDLGETCDYLTASAHKFGGPKGIGFLVIARDDKTFRGALGGPQEAGRRGGTENYPAIAAMVAALDESSRRGLPDPSSRDAFEHRIVASIPDARVIAGSSERLWNTSMLAFPGRRNIRILTALARSGFQVSTGSACSAGKGRPSMTLAAMSEPPETMGQVLRFSSGPDTSRADWMALADQLETIHEAMGD
jgi:cysteine desulfurase